MASLHCYCLLLITFFLTPNAYAVIVEGSFRGTVQSTSSGEYPLATGYWENAPEGSEVYGSFWYDAEILSNLSPDASYFYGNTDEWLGTSFTIGGNTYTLSDLRANGVEDYYGEQVEILSDDLAGTKDTFDILDIIGIGVQNRDSTMWDFNFS